MIRRINTSTTHEKFKSSRIDFIKRDKARKMSKSLDTKIDFSAVKLNFIVNAVTFAERLNAGRIRITKGVSAPVG